MAQQESDEEQVKFHDVAICFSEDDWKTLHEWQKDFYKHVMKEIHQALISMGYQIVNVNTLLRIYKGKDAFSQDSEDADRINIDDPIVSSEEPVKPDILLRMKKQQESYCNDRPHSKEAVIQNNSSSRVPIAPAAFSVKTEEIDVYRMDLQESDPIENGHSLPTEFPILHTVVGLTNELEAIGSLMGHPDADRDSSSGSSSGLLEIPAAVLAKIKDEPVYFTDNPEYEIFDAPIDNQRMTRMTRQKNAGQSLQYAVPASLDKASSKQRNTNVLQRAHKGPISVRQLRSDIYQEKRVDKLTARGSGLINSERFSMHQGRARIRIPQKDNEYESNLRNSMFRKGLLNAQQSQTSYRSTEFRQNSPLKRELIRHMETHLGVKPFACTDCDKIFFNKANLTKHYRTHSGEKPFMCTFCHKSFSRKDHLTRHIRIHTGERPYKCTECERSFPWISDLNHHRRNRH